MARSVDYLSHAYHVFYMDGSEIDDEFEWDDFKINLVETLTNILPSLGECGRWDGRETKIILENSFCEVGLAEYCGLISVSFRWHYGAEYNTEALFENWFNKVLPKLENKLNESFSMLNKVGRFSNGECLYERAS